MPSGDLIACLKRSFNNNGHGIGSIPFKLTRHFTLLYYLLYHLLSICNSWDTGGILLLIKLPRETSKEMFLSGLTLSKKKKALNKNSHSWSYGY
jgi:hypothetical protein